MNQYSLRVRAGFAALFLVPGCLSGLPALAADAPAAAKAPALVNCPQPVYPKGALRAEQTGKVTVEFLLGKDGKVAQTRVAKSSGHVLLDEASQAGPAACAIAPGAERGAEGAWYPVQYIWSLEGPDSEPPKAREPFLGAPAALGEFFAQARKADAIADPLARCLAFPDLPGHNWQAGLPQAYCELLFGKRLALGDVALLVARGAFAELDAIYQRSLDRHFSKTDFSERIHQDLYLFDASDEADRLSAAWVEKMPGSAFAQAARGEHLKEKAWKARGGRWSSDTPKENMYRMSQLAGQAKEHLGQAVRLDPRLLPAFATLVNLGKLNSETELGEAAFAHGNALDTACRYLSREQMGALSPRWGGSVEAMQSYARELAPTVASRPLMALTMVLPAADLGETYHRESQYAEAVKVLGPAARIAPMPELQGDLGLSMWRTDHTWWNMLAHVLTAYRYETDRFDVLRAAGTMMADEGDPLWARKLLKRALELKPEDKFANYQLGQAYHMLYEYEIAEPFLIKALDAGDIHENVLFLLAEGALRAPQLEKAEAHSSKFVASYPKSARGWFQRARLKSAQSADKDAMAALATFLKVVDRADPGWAGPIAFAKKHVQGPAKAGAAKPPK